MTTPDFPDWFQPSEESLHTLGFYLGLQDPSLQLVALYLISSPLLDTRGEYACLQAALVAHLHMAPEKIKALLEKLNACGFCNYDFFAERVTVPLVTQIYQTLFVQPPTALCQESASCRAYVQ